VVDRFDIDPKTKSFKEFLGVFYVIRSGLAAYYWPRRLVRDAKDQETAALVG